MSLSPLSRNKLNVQGGMWNGKAKKREGPGDISMTHGTLHMTQRMRGCSSVVERHVANVNVVGSNPITRSILSRGDFPPETDLSLAEKGRIPSPAQVFLWNRTMRDGIVRPENLQRRGDSRWSPAALT